MGMGVDTLTHAVVAFCVSFFVYAALRPRHGRSRRAAAVGITAFAVAMGCVLYETNTAWIETPDFVGLAANSWFDILGGFIGVVAFLGLIIQIEGAK